MYLPNKYTAWYNNIISSAQHRVFVGYSEKHHIIPKSLGGTNNKNNLVQLTPREHFICHILLTKMVDGKSKTKMVYAAMMLSITRSNIKITSRRYESIKIDFSKVVSERHTGKVLSDETKHKISTAKKGKPGHPCSNEKKYIMSVENTGKSLSDEHKQKISISNIGKPKSKEAKTNMSLAKKGKPAARSGTFKHNEETKQQISSALMGRTVWNTGLKIFRWVKNDIEAVYTRDHEQYVNELGYVYGRKITTLIMPV